MNVMHRQIRTAVVLAILLLFGCAESKLQVQPIAKTENPSQLIQKLGADIAAAQQNQVNVMAPTWFAKARQSHRNARDGLDKGVALASILDSIATGRTELQQAEAFADKSKFYLPEVIKSRQLAVKAGADKLGQEFAKLEEDFIKLTKAVEETDLRYVRNHRESVSAQYRELELRAIKNSALDNVRQLLQIAEDQKAYKMAPKSFALAQSKLAEADAFITQNRYAREAIQTKTEQARFYVERVQHIAQTSEKLKTMSPEDTALWLESFLHQTGTHLKEPDRRNMPFEIQQENFGNAIKELKNSYEVTENQVKACNQRLAELEGRTYQEKADKERLAAEKHFNELYSKVQGYFTSQEAEVYKKANQLIIRMKAIQFPVGQAVIMPSNYALLTKVQKAIQTFGKPDVIIEGHTDSTGSPTKNERLSESRAEAVREYLTANGTLPAQKIAAVGYGSKRPLASNETAEGRAINRRIDIVILPRTQHP